MKALKKKMQEAGKKLTEKSSHLSKVITDGIGEMKNKRAEAVLRKKEKKKQLERTRKENVLRRLPPKIGIEEEKKYILFPKEDERRNRKVEDFYIIGEELGKGAFAKVFKARSIPNGDLVAIKMIDKRLIEVGEMQLLLREINVTQNCSHVAIMKVYDVFESDFFISIVLELLPGGTLFSRISKCENGLPEVEARWIAYQVVSALYYLHTHAVAHRDIKPENILCLGDDGLTAKLGDFGFAKCFQTDPLKTACGTEDYAAPEILIGAPQYSYQVDMWSVGVVMYVTMCGYLPFDGDSLKENLEQMMSGQVVFDSDDWKDKSVNARDFIIRCLCPDPRLRLNAEQALQHPWFAGITKPTVTEGVVPVEEIVPVTDEEKADQQEKGILALWQNGEDENNDDESGLPPAHVPPTRPAPVLEIN